LGGEGGTEGIKTRLDMFSPIGKIGDGVGCGVIGTDGDAVRTGLSVVEFEDSDSGSVEVVRDSMDVFELIIHLTLFDNRLDSIFIPVLIAITNE